jgi:methylenetetrahydrofolate reductase (NADPH)
MRLKSKLDEGKFAILAEMEPPKGVDVSTMLASARRLKDRVDAFVVPDMNDAVLRMSSLGGAMILREEGMEPVMQLSCRDRNRLALQADLLAASACGIDNVMGVKGEDLVLGDHHQAKPVYDIQLLELLDVIQRLQRGQDMAGIDLSGVPQFLVGSTVNAGAKEKALERELAEMEKKIEGGVQFLVTPPLFDLPSIDTFLERVDHRKGKIIPTVLLLKSVGMARYIERNNDDVHIPEALIERIQNSKDRVNECIRIAVEITSTLMEEGFGGVHFSTVGWEDKLPEILEGIGI